MNPAPNAPVPNAPKKGMSGIVIGGCGCLVIVALVFLGGCFYLAKKGSKLVEDISANPVKYAATLVVKADPDLEIANSDDAKGEMTVRNKKTGEETTLTYKDISEGKWKWKNSKGEEITFDPGSKEGTMVVKNKEGSTTVVGGNSKATAPPAWVPIYPGMTAKDGGGMRSESTEKITGLYTAQTPDAPAKVKEFYVSKLTEAGFKPETSVVNAGSSEIHTVSVTKDDKGKEISVMINQEAGKATTISISYDGPKN